MPNEFSLFGPGPSGTPNFNAIFNRDPREFSLAPRRQGGGDVFGDILKSAVPAASTGIDWLFPAVSLGSSLLGDIFGLGKPKQPKGSRTTTVTKKTDPYDIFSTLGVVGEERDALNKIMARAFVENLTGLIGGGRPPGGR